jgi:hypothetical protein
MKSLIVSAFVFAVAFSSFADESPLFPDGVNQILGRIQPAMEETKLEKIVQTYYPDAAAVPGVWSGQTGYVEFRLTTRYTISIAEYSDPDDFASRFVHQDMIFYVYDHELKRRTNITFYRWDEESKPDERKTSEPVAAPETE